MRGLKKNCMGRGQTNRQTHGHVENEKEICCSSADLLNLLKDPNSNGTYIQPKPSALKNIFTKMLNTMGNSLLLGSKKLNDMPQFLLKDSARCMSWLCPLDKGHYLFKSLSKNVVKDVRLTCLVSTVQYKL